MARTYHPRGELIEGFKARNHPLYCTWANMLARCFDLNKPNYKDYGGRGITVCERWHHFKNFVNDMGPKPSKLHSLDRIDNDKGYSFENCRWATRTEQNKNKRVYRTSRTGVSGIRFREDKYQVRVTINNTRKSIGNFNTLQEALDAREAAIRKTSI